MESAPASIPATTPAAFTSAFGHGTRASMFGNGRVVVITADGSFRLYFRRGQQSAFETLALELGATVYA
jgi:hypothetical protein